MYLYVYLQLLVFYPSWYCPLGTGVEFYGQNPLSVSVTKVICRQFLITWRKILISSKLKSNFESSTWTVEVIRTRFPFPGYWIFWEITKKIWNTDEIWEVMLWLRLHWLFHVCFGEIRFLKWHDLINSWFLGTLKEFSSLPLFKLFFS